MWAEHKTANTAHGPMLYLGGIALVTAMSAIVHAQGQTVPLGQIVFWRSAMALPVIILWAIMRGGHGRAWRTDAPRLHLARSLMGVTAMALAFAALARLPLANAQALSYLAPILVLPIAAHRLGEPVGSRLIGIIALGFSGVLLLLWQALILPGTEAAIGVAAGLGFALLTAFTRVHIKQMTRSQTPEAIAFYFALTGTLMGLLSLPLSPHGWPVLPVTTLGALCGAGVLGGLAHLMATEATRRSNVSQLAPLEYTGLAWALGFDLILFATWPNELETLGMALILGAALYSFPRRNRP